MSTDPRAVAAFQKHYGPSEYANDPLNPRHEAFMHGFREGAAEISRLTAELEERERLLRSSVPERLQGQASPVAAVQGYIFELQDELEEARKDAGRYRWLRDSPDADLGILRWAHEWERKLIDGTVDAAMTKEEP